MTSKLTREQLHERARENVKALKMASRQHAFESAREEILADLQLTEYALARLEGVDSEPVAYTDQRNLGYIDRGRETAYLWGKQNSEDSDVALYRHAQPGPVVSEDLYKLANHIASSKNGLPNEWQDWAEELEADIRRAAMLQAGSSPAHLIPDGWIPVSERLPEKNGMYQVWNGKHMAAHPFFFGSFQCINPEQITHWMPLPAAPQEVKGE